MIAYLILIHRYPEQFKRLFTAVYDTKNYYLIHVDKKADKKLLKNIKDFLEDFPNVYLLKSQNVIWGGYSMVNVELKGIKKLLQLSKKWDFFINLSGQDYPLQSQSSIQDFLKLHKGSSFLKIANQAEQRPNTLNRIDNFFEESDHGFVGKPIKRSYMPKVIPYIGGQWKILSRECCEFISNSSKVAKFRHYYKNTLIPDESFFQTVLMNTNYPGKIVNDDKRAIIWVPDFGSLLHSQTFTENTTRSLIASGKIKLRPKTFITRDLQFLLSSKALFARKFDETVDTVIFGLLESKSQILHPTKTKNISSGVIPMSSALVGESLNL